MRRAPSVLDSGADEILAGVHNVADDEQLVPREQRLWLAVVARAWGDAFQVSDGWIRNSDRKADPEFVRGEARRWLLLDFGEWREDRETVCSLAGLDPDVLRRAAKRRLADVKGAERPTAEVVTLDLDRAFARLLDDADDMDPETLDASLAELAALERAA